MEKLNYFLNEHPEFLTIAFALILMISSICFLVLSSVIRWKKSQSADVQRLPATLIKIMYDTGYANCRVYFLVDGEKKRRYFDSRRSFISKMPESGTKGILTFKGHILYSFEWDGKKVVQDDPFYGKTGYADLI